MLLLPAVGLAQQPGAKATSPAATFAARPAGSDKYVTLPAAAELRAGEPLVCLPGASLVSRNGAVALTSLADYDGRSPLPILETAFTLNEAKDADLDLTLDRGRVDLTSKKADGPAAVRVRFRDQAWKVTLDSAGTRVALEACGRWPSGTRFRPAEGKDATGPPGPVSSAVLLVLSGSASVDVGGVTFAAKAPPGPAVLEWESGGPPPQPLRLEKLPPWAEPDANLTPEGKRLAAAVEKFRAARAANPEAALDAFLGSKDPVELRVALVTLGATDDLGRLAKTLVAARSLDEWDFGVTVLRHWIGRGPGQDQAFYRFLQTARGYPPAQARIVMQLLLGFTPQELRQPETYDVLIEYLRHDKPGVRNLAAWHLVRLVPQGKSIPFRPDGTAADAEAAYRAWKKLVPDGQLPPPPAKKK